MIIRARFVFSSISSVMQVLDRENTKRFIGTFREYKMVTLTTNGLKLKGYQYAIMYWCI